ncbi:hypothetical protein [Sphingomonas xinjiangensis]|uniref:Uncharacterized protein n=1 Tax=Sphingomonas xinjiangensis TaxID=643568 RepID=A0A840YRT7_9SPHN|nr:hypothetical protein [Sphingomonas xinjiangensis]MBB5712394.1 hypothetical protein [Sphingomonas xinjiangensis]
MPLVTVHTSLSFDPIIKSHPHRLSAEAHMIKVLREYGDWPQDAAVDAARAGKPVLVRDGGDDEVIGIDDIG